MDTTWSTSRYCCGQPVLAAVTILLTISLGLHLVPQRLSSDGSACTGRTELRHRQQHESSASPAIAVVQSPPGTGLPEPDIQVPTVRSPQRSGSSAN